MPPPRPELYGLRRAPVHVESKEVTVISVFHAGTLLTTTGVGLPPLEVDPVMAVELVTARPLSAILQKEESVNHDSSSRLPRADGMVRLAIMHAAHAAYTCRWIPPRQARQECHCHCHRGW